MIDIKKLPDDIIQNIKEHIKKIEINDYTIKYNKILNDIIVKKLRLHKRVQQIIYNEIDLKNILTNLENTYEQFIYNKSLITLDFIKTFTDKKDLKFAYELKCKIIKIKNKKHIFYNQFVDIIHKKLFDKYQMILIDLFKFLQEYKNEIHYYFINYGFMNEYDIRVYISEYFIHAYFCKNILFTNHFSNYIKIYKGINDTIIFA